MPSNSIFSKCDCNCVPNKLFPKALDDALEQALKQHPQLKAAAADISAVNHEIKASNSGFYPKVSIDYFQSNIEGELIDKIQEVGFSYDGIVLNAAAYTHTSVGIGDAIKAIETPVIEVHISNTFGREEFRHQSFISPNAKGVILGFGLQSYELAIQSFL